MFSGRLAFRTGSVRPHVACNAGPNVNVNVARDVPALSRVPRRRRTNFGGDLGCVNFRPNRGLRNRPVSCMFLNTYAGNHVRSFHTFTSLIGKGGGTRNMAT